MMNVRRAWKVSLFLSISSLCLTNVQLASASEVGQTRDIVNQVNDIPEIPITISGDLNQKRIVGNYVVSAPEEVSPTSTIVSASSIIDTLKWVCKSALTLVGVGAWVTSVYYSGGIILTVSNWVIRYVTVPSLLCNWL
jgi:hypothetical protein